MSLRAVVRDGVTYAPELCVKCEPVCTFGLARVDDPRLVRVWEHQYADARGLVHDPIMHHRDCPAINGRSGGPS